MERDFLGLNQRHYSSQQGFESASEVIRPKPLTPSRFLSSNNPTREDDICYPFPFGSNTAKPSLAKNAWTLPTTNTTPNSSTNVTNSRNNNLQQDQLASLSMLYSGKVHVFQNISPEKVELIMRIAGSTSACVTSEPGRTLELIPTENHGTNMQLQDRQSHPCPYFAKGGLAMARKATLARFLEKRMHRLSNPRPYNLNEKFSRSISEQEISETNASPWQSKQNFIFS